jgi:hypothetical protein
MIAEGTVNLISSDSGVGKTFLALALAGAVATGRDFLDKHTTQRPVLYLDGENPLFVVRDRLALLGIPRTPNLHIWGRWEVEEPPGPGDKRIEEWVKINQPLLIWDSLIAFHDGEEQSSTETRRFMQFFRHLADLGATVVILHHTGKADSSQQYRGSSDIKAAVDMAFKLEPVTKNPTKLDRLSLTAFKTRFSSFDGIGVQFTTGKGFSRCDVVKAPEPPDPLEIVKRIVAATPGLNQSQIVALANGQVGKNHVADLLLSPCFTFERGRGNEHLYRLKEPGQTETTELVTPELYPGNVERDAA